MSAGSPSDGSQGVVDVAIIGAGVVGAAIGRELSRYALAVVLIDAAPDVGSGTSKANTAILHTGFDAKPGTLEARLVRRGWELYGEFAQELGIPIERTGAVLVAWTPDELAELGPIRERAVANGYERARLLSADEVYGCEPHLGPGALGGLEVPDESITCTFTAPLAFATQAVANGVVLELDQEVVGVARRESGEHVVKLARGRSIHARWVVNAAGLRSDLIDRMLGHDGFSIRPRRGELIVFDKMARRLVRHIVLPVPTKVGKGVLVSPTVYGNIVLGPTAEDVESRVDTACTAAGLDALQAKGGRIMPALLAEDVTATYAGLRAATEHPDYQLFLVSPQRYVCAGGIRSTGLTASPAIAEHVVGLMAGAGLSLRPKSVFKTIRMPNIGEGDLRPYQDREAIERDPRYGSIVCHCERVTRGEVLDALRAPIPPRSFDGLRRRTRVMMGRCQGFYCTAEIMGLVGDRTDVAIEELQFLRAATGPVGRHS